MINNITSFLLGMIFVGLLFPHRKRWKGRFQRLNLFIKANVIGFASVVLAFLAGLIVSNLIYHWDLVGNSFFSVKLIEIVQVVAALLIALFITYFIQNKLSHNIKKREIISDLFSLVEKNTSQLHDSAFSYIHNPDAASKHNITSNFRKLGILLSIIKKSKKPKDDISIDAKALFKAYFTFKESVTDKPFSKFSDSERDELTSKISAAYQDLLYKIYKCRFDIYGS